MTWTKLKDVGAATPLVGLRIRHKGRVLGFIKSGWGRGLWLTPKRQEWGQVHPWFPPEQKTIADVADELEVDL